MESVLCFPSVASFPRPSSRRQLQQWLMSIVFAAGQHGPGDARQFVGNCYHDFVARSTLGQSVHPLPQSSSVVLDAKQYRPSTVDQHATQINVAALADAESFCFPPVEYCRGTTPTQAAKSRPRRKAAPLPMAATVAVETSGPKPGIWRSRWQRCIFLTNTFNLVGDGLRCRLQSASTPATCDPAASAGAGVRFCSASSITAGRFLRR